MNLKEKYKSSLHNGICMVSFIKLNGDERIMNCTLNKEFIPEDHRPSGTKQRVDREDQIVAYDTDAEGWRTFKIDSVIEFKSPL